VLESARARGLGKPAVAHHTPSAVMRNLPGGATTRVHQLPNPSRYIDNGTAGSITMVSARTKSWLRV